MNKYKVTVHRDGTITGDEEALLLIQNHFNGSPEKGLQIGSILCG